MIFEWASAERAMQVNIVPGSPQSIYRQITDQVRRLVATDKLAVGDAVPSVRQLAKDLVVNPNTVAKAYAELVRDGVLESQQGRGFFVARRKNIFSKAERLRRLDETLDVAISEGITLDFSVEEIVERMQVRINKLLPQER
jgi:GntR family transcriptional regulator